MICIVLQNCMDIVEGETGNCNRTGVMCGDDGTEEVSMKFEDAIDIKEEIGITVEDAIDIKEEFSFKVEYAEDIKDEIPEPITFTTIKTEQEVRLWCVCWRQLVLSIYVFIDLWQFEGKMA